MWREQLKRREVASSNATSRLIKHLPTNPVLNAEKTSNLLGASWRTGARVLELLEQVGILVQRSAGKRNRVYEAEDTTGAFATAIKTSPVQQQENTSERSG